MTLFRQLRLTHNNNKMKNNCTRNITSIGVPDITI